MGRHIAAAVVVAGLCIGAGDGIAALNPDRTDILGFQLGMPESTVAITLHRLGIRADRVSRHVTPCDRTPQCRIILTVATHDGDIMIGLNGEPPVVDLVSYRFRSITPGAPEIIAEAVLQHYGRPDHMQPMTWCEQRASARDCGAATPNLRFFRDTLTLLLSSGGPALPLR